MKKLALGLAIATSLVASTAIAAPKRPDYIAFKAPQAVGGVANPAGQVTQFAAPSVAKHDEAFGTLPIWVPLIGLIAVIGLVAAVSGGSNGSPG
ncbi:hypothetical protein ACQEPB_01335 [Novosphingobium fluoreni]|uniref:hypothetical protein n=1 Tax=Novosphingobium fluoreni TaxID=1391222 RepID=UPI003D9FC2C1